MIVIITMDCMSLSPSVRASRSSDNIVRIAPTKITVRRVRYCHGKLSVHDVKVLWSYRLV